MISHLLGTVIVNICYILWLLLHAFNEEEKNCTMNVGTVHN